MCLILFSWKVHPTYRLVVAANRDEFHARPTGPLEFWDESPGLLAGRDLEKGGTWLGLTRSGRFAAVTNYRDPGAEPCADRPSRGQLVREYLEGDASPADAMADLERRADAFAGFSLLLGDRTDLYWYSNRAVGSGPVPPGVHGLSNAGLDVPWPKVTRGKAALEGCLQAEQTSVQEVLQLLGDRTVPADDELPETGFGIEKERLLAPLFIVAPTYGTRSSTAVLIDRQDQVSVVECRLDPEGRQVGTRGFAFKLRDE